MNVTINLSRLFSAWVFNLVFAIVLPLAYNPGQLSYVPGAMMLFFTGAFFSTVIELCVSYYSKRKQ